MHVRTHARAQHTHTHTHVHTDATRVQDSAALRNNTCQPPPSITGRTNSQFKQDAFERFGRLPHTVGFRGASVRAYVCTNCVRAYVRECVRSSYERKRKKGIKRTWFLHGRFRNILWRIKHKGALVCVCVYVCTMKRRIDYYNVAVYVISQLRVCDYLKRRV